MMALEFRWNFRGDTGGSVRFSFSDSTALEFCWSFRGENGVNVRFSFSWSRLCLRRFGE